MLAQFPLLYLTGFFESRVDHGKSSKGFPLWMQIDSKSVMAAVTLGSMYLAVVAAQRWDLSVGPLDPTPPLEFDPAIRAMWFAMFTLGASMLFFMTAAGIVIPILRFVTYPLRYLPIAAAAVLALLIGAGLGLVILSAMQSTKIATSIDAAKAAMDHNPAVFVTVFCVVTVGPLLLGLVLKGKDDD
jgi:hypothetical protein